MKIYSKHNGKMIARGDFVIGQIWDISIDEKNEKETVFDLSLRMENLRPVPPAKGLRDFDLFVIISKENTCEFSACVFDETGDLIPVIFEFCTHELLSLLAYIVNYCEKEK